jgi:hypothetical protein
MEEVVKFCLDGLREPDGTRRRGPLGEMTGVVNWLVADGVSTANFYLTKSPVPMLFVSLPDTGSNPWSLIPGFMEFVREGELTVNLINRGEITLVARTDIDTVLKERVSALHRLPPVDRANLTNAMIGRGNLEEALQNLEERSRDRISQFF